MNNPKEAPDAAAVARQKAAIAIDARAKIIWGESPVKVLTFLQSKGLADADAAALIEEFVKERAASIREDGIKKTLIGSACLLAPIAYYYVSLLAGYWSLKVFAALIVLGAWGVTKVMKGLSMALKPRAVKGDLANGEV